MESIQGSDNAAAVNLFPSQVPLECSQMTMDGTRFGVGNKMEPGDNCTCSVSLTRRTMKKEKNIFEILYCTVPTNVTWVMKMLISQFICLSRGSFLYILASCFTFKQCLTETVDMVINKI